MSTSCCGDANGVSKTIVTLSKVKVLIEEGHSYPHDLELLLIGYEPNSAESLS